MSESQTRGYESLTKVFKRHTASVTWDPLRHRDHHYRFFAEDDFPNGEKSWSAEFRRLTEGSKDFDDYDPNDLDPDSDHSDSDVFTFRLRHLNEGKYGVLRKCHSSVYQN